MREKEILVNTCVSKHLWDFFLMIKGKLQRNSQVEKCMNSYDIF